MHACLGYGKHLPSEVRFQKSSRMAQPRLEQLPSVINRCSTAEIRFMIDTVVACASYQHALCIAFQCRPCVAPENLGLPATFWKLSIKISSMAWAKAVFRCLVCDSDYRWSVQSRSETALILRSSIDRLQVCYHATSEFADDS